MKKWLMFSFLAVGIIALSGEANDVYAQKSSGKSFSSGGSSSRPSSGSSSSSSGKSFSSGSKPSTPSITPTAPKPSSSGKSFSTGSTPSTPKSTPTPSASSGGKSFGTGTSNSSKPSSAKPSSGGWNPGLSNAARKDESQKAYQTAKAAKTKPAEAPKSTYKTDKGEERPIKADSPNVTTVRRTITHERYVTYDNRASVFYGSYYSHPQPYNDFFSPFLMGMMFSAAWDTHSRALWVYHHYDPYDPYNSISEDRYRELLRRDARLQAEVELLKAQNIQRNTGYVPPQFTDDPDLMYNKDFVGAAYNPQPDDDDGHSGVFWFFVILFSILGAAFVIWLVYCAFFKDYP